MFLLPRRIMEGFRVIHVYHAQGTCSVFIYILDTEGDLMTTQANIWKTQKGD